MSYEQTERNRQKGTRQAAALQDQKINRNPNQNYSLYSFVAQKNNHTTDSLRTCSSLMRASRNNVCRDVDAFHLESHHNRTE